MYKAKHLSPMIPSFNLETTVNFFTDILHFSVALNNGTYFVLDKDDQTLHIQRAGLDIGEMSVYMEVDDISALWKTLGSKTDTFQIKAPFDREYGMREIHIIVPETKTLLFIAQRIS